MKRTIRSLAIVAILLGVGKILMSQTSASGGVRNIVLVHGGFVDGSGWQDVYKALKKDGYTVAIVQNPTISLVDDVAATKRIVRWTPSFGQKNTSAKVD